MYSLALVPASAAPLKSIALGEDNLLLSYMDRRARLWDIRTLEFWRSMSAEKADEMVKQGGWQEWSVPCYATDFVLIPGQVDELSFAFSRCHFGSH